MLFTILCLIQNLIKISTLRVISKCIDPFSLIKSSEMLKKKGKCCIIRIYLINLAVFYYDINLFIKYKTTNLLTKLLLNEDF